MFSSSASDTCSTASTVPLSGNENDAEQNPTAYVMCISSSSSSSNSSSSSSSSGEDMVVTVTN